MMRRALSKDTFRDIKKSLSKFISMVAIVAIGVAFFAGIKVASPDMKITADNYYDKQNFMDIQLISTLGLTEEDVEAIKELEEIEGVFPTYSLDVLTNLKTKELVLKIHGISLESIKNQDENYINKPLLVEGRFPEKSGECVIDASKMSHYNIEIGSTIEVTSGTDKDIGESLKTNKFTVVGTVHSPLYVSFEKGSSSIGNGTVSGFIMIPNEDFNLEAYTEMFVTVKGAKELQTHSKGYEESIDEVEDQIKPIGTLRSETRYEEIMKEANEKLNNSKKELNDGKSKAEKELKKAEEKLNSSRQSLVSGEEELSQKEKNFHIFALEAEQKIKDGENSVQIGEAEYNKKYNDFFDTKKSAEVQFKIAEEEIRKGEEGLKTSQDYLGILKEKIKDDNISEVEKQQLQIEIEKLKAIISTTEKNISEGKKELEANKAKISEGERQLAAAKTRIEASKTELEKKKSELEKGKDTAKNEFAQAHRILEEGKIDLTKGEEEYSKAKLDAEKKIKDGEVQITEAEKKIKNIKEPKWYVLDRNTNYSFVDYEGSADRVNAIAQVFPVFFFLVAALVCLTTMTRMVDEQRGNIGILKALGYSKWAIISKYIIYASSASITGSIIGLAIGFTVFPTVIANAYGIMYELPPVILTFNVKYAILSTLAAVITTTMAAVLACYKELVETPALLMRPKAPVEGKRILLERIPFIWNKFSFIKKVSARNIFRYKKRFLMTVIGIAGCTSLLLAGFGIKDSIRAIVDKQFREIYKFEMTLDLENGLDREEYKNTLSNLSRNNKVDEYMSVGNFNVKIYKEGVEKEVKVSVPDKPENLEEFIQLRQRKSGKGIKLDDEGIVISEKVAKMIDANLGDTVYIKRDDEEKIPVKINGITEHYVFHYIYMTPALYEKLYGEEIDYNQVIAKISDTSKVFEDNLAKDMIEMKNIKSVNFNSGIRNNFEDTIKSLNYVVLVMIVSAGSLAFVVLYNLTNVNISERMREIATLKVLGFYDKEVSAYVYRENFILAFIGMLGGLGLGVLLHRFIMITAEVESIMFGRIITSFSYLWAALLTLLFTGIVNMVMYYKLKNIHMVESLKSVD